MEANELRSLFNKYLADTLSEAEFRQLWATLEQPEAEEKWMQLMDEMQEGDPVHGLSGATRENLALAAIKQKMAITPVTISRIHFLKRTWFRYAAAVLLLAGTASYFIYQQVKDQPFQNIAQQHTDIEPGRSGAILTLSNGSQVVLDSMNNGTVTTQNGTRVMLANGQLAYDAQQASAVSYNTMTIPRGRQFQLQLPDGTKVWLNSASSLRYPTAFTGSERVVEVTGEAYFEVAQHAEQPFKVKVNNETEIQVLGTNFNVSAYTNENLIHTTLLEGRVRVQAFGGKDGVVLSPGSQARIANNKLSIVEHPDVEKIMAWKNGLFNFDGASLQEVMNQLERWYDIEVVYEKGIPDIKFFGEMSRNVKLSDVLAGLQGAGVHFKVDGRRLTVIP